MIKIGIAGCMSRIGTTTQTIQLIEVLREMEKSVCYAEENEKNYLEQLVQAYNKAEDKKQFVRFSGIDMYKNGYSDRVKDSSYEMMVCDFGNIDRRSFDRLKFEKMDIKIVVCGSKPSEIAKLEPLLRNPLYDDAFFVFSFVPQDERMAISAMMKSRKNNCFFSNIIFDPYEKNQESYALYHKLLSRYVEERSNQSTGGNQDGRK